ncbi:MAG: ABC transporter ATP-binding protein [Verrucomicrobia bacterium]|nr:ABC transporter ATP-binding protein [Verrucomicrobiota bacterium]
MNPDAPAVCAVSLVRRFQSVTALDGVSLEVRRGEFFALLGPSGCGKTTLLRIIAGLDQPDSGSLQIAGAEALQLPAHRRPVNTVFQSYALFPHLNVRDNIAFGLRMKKVARPELDRRVRDVMDLAQVAELAARKPSQLSGGQKQRVALARALVNEPQVLLLDEPLGALDLKLRRELQADLRALHRRLGITFIHVTHDQEEALALSDRIAVMNAGRIAQTGPGADIYERPRTRFVAQFLGACNLIEGTVECVTRSTLTLATPLGALAISTPEPCTRPAGSRLTAAVRPERILLGETGAVPALNRIEVRVEQLVFSGATTDLVLRAGTVRFRAQRLNANASAAAFQPGATLTAGLPAEALVPLDD